MSTSVRAQPDRAGITTYIRNQIAEIEADRAIRLYGACVALLNGITAVFWLTSYKIDAILDPETSPICWPLLEGCYRWRVLPAGAIALVTIFLGIAAVVNARLFIETHRAGLAYLVLAVTTGIKLAILLQDYRLAANQHYMALWIAAAYLFVPNRRASIPLMIVLFYVWAGLLKLGGDWLSGAALLGRRPFDMPAAWVPAACLYVVVLELGQTWALLSRRAILFWLVFAQLVLFHISSFWVVGYFYPILMFLILGLLPLMRFIEPPEGTRSRHWGHAVAIVFCLLQLSPRLLSSDPAITGEGRLLALNMFDAPIRCVATLTPHTGEPPANSLLRVPYLQPRLACDPIVYLEAAKATCRDRPGDLDFDLTLRSKRSSRPDFSTVISLQRVCSISPRYSLLRHNWWIIDPGM
jgi:hypothetical protein